MKVVAPADPRLAPIFALRTMLPFAEDGETQIERRIARRMDIREAVKK